VRAALLRRILLPALDAEDLATPPPTGFDAIQREELSRLFGAMVKARLVALPILVAILAWLATGDPATWRRVVLVVSVPAIAIFFLGEAVRYRRRGLARRAVEVNVTAAMVGQLVLSAVSGGVESPFLPLAIPLAIIGGLFLSRRAAYLLATAQVVSFLALAAVAALRVVPAMNPVAFGGGANGGHSPAHLWTSALLLGAIVVMGQGAGRVLRRAFDAMLRRALAAQEDALRAHAERAEELTALSAEIAHELKNPLASVKGLAALLQPGDGRSAERLAVLRREVDRMQGILDEFLNFSRPLVPLALGRVDLATLAREVAALHEGIAHQRGVVLELRAVRAEARCDPRKVKQVLINLVQNALEASAGGATVELEVTARDGSAHVRVLDRGRGVDPDVEARAFDPGVTTKPLGSGIGLTIARALARQHGGDVTLTARSGGGCVADLALPATAGEGRAA
jgi:two-component system sensor histidine kinase HydH